MTRLPCILLLAVLLTGCAGTSPTRLVSDTLGAVGGAIIGHTLGKDDPLITAAGAGGGVLLAEGLQSASAGAAQRSYRDGYDKGRSDAVKQQYWLIVENQRPAADAADQEDFSLYEIPVPAHEANGALFNDSTRVLSVPQ